MTFNIKYKSMFVLLDHSCKQLFTRSDCWLLWAPTVLFTCRRVLAGLGSVWTEQGRVYMRKGQTVCPEGGRRPLNHAVVCLVLWVGILVELVNLQAGQTDNLCPVPDCLWSRMLAVSVNNAKITEKNTLTNWKLFLCYVLLCFVILWHCKMLSSWVVTWQMQSLETHVQPRVEHHRRHFPHRRWCVTCREVLHSVR